MNNENILSDLNKRIAEKYRDFKGSYLFGSRAKGKYHEYSDYDIVVLFEEINREKKFELYGIIGDIEYKYDIFIDIKFLTDIELKSNPIFYNEVVNNGIFYREQ